MKQGLPRINRRQAWYSAFQLVLHPLYELWMIIRELVIQAYKDCKK